MENLVKSVLNIQKIFIQNAKNQQPDIKKIIGSMIPLLQSSLGAEMSQEIGDVLNNVSGLLD